MTKRSASLDLILPPRARGVPAYQWLYGAVRAEILEGRLHPGTRLPATRDLAEQHGLARGTVVAAFEQLEAEGYVDGTVGSGTYVSKVLPEELLHAGGEARPLPEPGAKPRRRLSAYARRLEPFPPYDHRRRRAFRANVPALDLFPTTLWAKLAARRFHRLTAPLLLGSEAMGHAPLREAVAGYLAQSRGVRCEPGQVLIVSGIQEALDLSARILLDPGDRVAIEDPGYTGAASVFEAAGARVIGVDVDGEGMQVRASRLRGVRLAYVTPAHQFPLGVTMTLARRLELLEWARQSGATIFEDDYDSEYRYRGRPIPALQGLDRAARVLFAGSFSKVMFPSLRLGYLVVPPDLVPRFDAAKSLTTRHASLLDQVVLCDFIAEGHFGRHLRRMREIYGERLAALIEGARRELAGAIDVSDVEAGLQTFGWLRAGLDGVAVARAAAKRDVDLTPLREYCRRRIKRDGVQLGFAAVDVAEIRRGVRELAAVLR